MKKILIIFFCFPLIGLGQNTYNVEHSYSKGLYKYLIADNVNVRSGPSINNTIVANIPIGTRLKIIEETNYLYTYNNINFPWYKVSFFQGNRETTGYVVGGFIAEESSQPYEINNTIFLAGLYKYYQDGSMKYQIRVVQDNKEIDKIEFYAYPSDDFRFNVYKNYNMGLDVIIIQFIEASCAIQLNERTFFFDNNKLYHIRTFSNTDLKTLGFSRGKVQLYEWKWINSDIGYEMDGGYYNKEFIKEYIWDGNRLIRN